MRKRKSSVVSVIIASVLCIGMLFGAPLFITWRSYTGQREIVQHDTVVTATVSGSNTTIYYDDDGDEQERTTYYLTWQYAGEEYSASRKNTLASNMLNLFRGDYSSSLREGRTFEMYIDPANPARGVLATSYEDNALFIRWLVGIIAVCLALTVLRAVLMVVRRNRQAVQMPQQASPYQPQQQYTTLQPGQSLQQAANYAPQPPGYTPTQPPE